MGFSRQEYWVAISSSRGFSWPRNWTGVSYVSLVGRRILYQWSSCWAPYPGGNSDKEPSCQCSRLQGCRFDPWLRKIIWRKKWQATPVFLPGESHGQRSLVGYGLWCRRVRRNWAAECVCAYTYTHTHTHTHFIYFWLRWVFIATRGLSLVAASGVYLHCGARTSHSHDFSCFRAQALGTRASAVAAHRISSCDR